MSARRRYGARRRRKLRRPRACISIEPYGLHAGLRRAHHIGQGVVAHVQDFDGPHARRAQQMREYSRVGLGRTRGGCSDLAVEQVGDTAALEIGIAVAERKQPILRAQALERGTHVGVELDAVAFSQENLECVVGRGPLEITRRGEHLGERPSPQERKIVALCGNRSATPARKLRIESTVSPSTARGWCSRSHDSSAASAAAMTGPTGHKVSSRSRLMTRGCDHSGDSTPAGLQYR